MTFILSLSFLLDLDELVETLLPAIIVVSEETSLNFDDDFICKIFFIAPSDAGVSIRAY